MATGEDLLGFEPLEGPWYRVCPNMVRVMAARVRPPTFT